MKKFIVAIDGLHYHSAAVEYAVHVSKMNAAHLTGIMLDDNRYTSYKIYELIIEEGISENKLKQYKIKDVESRKESSDKFELLCQSAKLNYNLHHDHDLALEELIKETLFADLLFISIEERFSHHQGTGPSPFLKQLLKRTCCPVIICPSQYYDIKKILFLYDGKLESLFAMKQFALLFGNQQEMEVELISVKSVEESNHLPQHHLVKEWLKRHFKEVNLKVLKGIPEIEIINFLRYEQSIPLLVTGAYGRSNISRFIRPSLADVLMKNYHFPIFIAHSH